MMSNEEPVRTLFVSGLPDDVKPREIHNLFRTMPGYLTCQLKFSGRGSQIVAFVLFSNYQQALAAKVSLNGTLFDPETGASLQVEFARANSRIKKSAFDVTDGGFPYDNKIRGSADILGASKGEGAYGNLETSEARDTKREIVGVSETVEENNISVAQGHSLGASSTLPCSTLFIANLGPTCTEDELHGIFSGLTGFKNLKMRNKGGMPVAFVDYEDTSCSAEALHKMQGYLLPSSDRGGVHLQYAKSKMRHQG